MSFEQEPSKPELEVRETDIPGLFEVNLVVHEDERGSFKEGWQKKKMEALGLPELNPVQLNVSTNEEVGATRGIHAEPWNKFISIPQGEVFAAIVDLRQGDTFGVVETFHLDRSKAIYVPEGCGNSYQTLAPETSYTYLVDDYWTPETKYTMLNLADPTVQIEWPIRLDEAIVSDKDKVHPLLEEVVPVQV